MTPSLALPSRAVLSPAELSLSGAGQVPLAPLASDGQLVPLVQGGSARWVNLDYAASAPALRAVADHVAQVLPLYASVHRGASYASEACTAAYEAARRQVAALRRRPPADDVAVFTRNTTDALNLLATAVPGEVVHLDVEHHANLLPWQARGSPAGARPRHRGRDARRGRGGTGRRPAALLTVTGASNVTGECLPVERLAEIAHRHGARIAVDGAQLVPHRRVDLSAIGVDYLALSGHKMYAPFGAGVLVGRRDWLDAAPAYLAGGGAVREVTTHSVRWAPAPARHEAGTPDVLGAVALAAACRELAALPDGAVAAHEEALLGRLDAGLAEVGARVLRIWPDARRIGCPRCRSPCPASPRRGSPPTCPRKHGIGVRDGLFCAHPLLARLGAADGAVRVSLGLGSQASDIDRLIAALGRLRADGPSWSYTADHRPSPDTRPLPDWAHGTADGPGPACVGGR